DILPSTDATGRHQQILFACTRDKPPRAPSFPSRSYLVPMSGCSLLRNCIQERVVAGRFTVKNQLSFSTSGPGIHFAVRIVDLYLASGEILLWNNKRVSRGEQRKEELWLIAKPAP